MPNKPRRENKILKCESVWIKLRHWKKTTHREENMVEEVDDLHSGHIIGTFEKDRVEIHEDSTAVCDSAFLLIKYILKSGK